MTVYVRLRLSSADVQHAIVRCPLLCQRSAPGSCVEASGSPQVDLVLLCLQEKERLKAEKEAAEAKYKWALVDGRREQVGTACFW